MYNMRTISEIITPDFLIRILVVLTLAITVCMVLQKVSAFESYIPYGKFADSHKSYIGFHITDRYLWYLNNDEDGFNLDGVLSDEQQKNWDDQK